MLRLEVCSSVLPKRQVQKLDDMRFRVGKFLHTSQERSIMEKQFDKEVVVETVSWHNPVLPSGKLTVCYGKWSFIVDLPIYPLKMVVFHSCVNVYQRVTGG